MIDIALLGGVSVNVGGVQLSGEAAQRRRVALLALLAAPTLRPVSRDRLIGWLWPDHDPESARHLLSAALHVLRKALGPDALLTTGDDVALNPAVVAVDAAAFRAAVAGGDVEGALALYGGEFMEGFFVNDAGDFSQWVDGERDELKRLYGETLERAAAARAAAGNPGGTAEAWRRRAAVDPYDTRVALELMKALAASGQRGAAIQHARLHGQLLEQEFGAEPDPQVEALAAELRQAPADGPRPAHVAGPAVAATGEPPAIPHAHDVDGAAAPRAEAPSSQSAAVTPAAAPLPAGPPSQGLRRPRPLLRPAIAISAAAVLAAALLLAFWRSSPEPAGRFIIGVRPFQSDEASLAAQGRALAEFLISDLGRIEDVQLVNRDVAAATANLEPPAAIQQMGSLGSPVDALLDMSLYPEGAGVRANLQLTGKDGVNIISDGLYALAAGDLNPGIVERVATKLGRKVRPRSDSRPEYQPSGAALNEYLVGRSQWLSRTPDSLRGALDHLLLATKLDTLYARAWAGLADAYNMLGSYDYAGMRPGEAYPAAKRAAERAIGLQPDLSDAYAALANVQANYDWDWDAAEDNYRRALELPDGQHTSAAEWLALLLAARGRFQDAKRLTLKAVQSQAGSQLTLINRAHVLYYASDFDEAMSTVERALALPDRKALGRAYLLHALIAFFSGQRDSALAELSKLRAMTPNAEPLVIATLGYVQAAVGQRDSALAQLRWLQQREAGGRQYVPPELIGLVYVGLGDKDSAFRELKRAYDDHSSGMAYLEVEPLIAPLRNDSRYHELVELVEKWRSK